MTKIIKYSVFNIFIFEKKFRIKSVLPSKRFVFSLEKKSRTGNKAAKLKVSKNIAINVNTINKKKFNLNFKNIRFINFDMYFIYKLGIHYYLSFATYIF